MAHRPFVQERSSHRPARFAQRVKEELAQMIPGELRDPRLLGLGFLTITDVTITPDLKHCTIMFALMGNEDNAKDVTDGLNAAAGFLRKELMRKLDTKITPQLLFRHDKGLTSTMEINSLLHQISLEPKSENTPEAAVSSEADAHTDDSNE